MNVTVEMQCGILVAKLEGELDLLTVNEFREAIDSVLNRSESKNLILNLSKLTFIDSSGIGALLGRYKKIKLLGGKVAITNVQPQVMRILEFSGLHRVLSSYSTEQQALERI